jgi:hypothetical protein
MRSRPLITVLALVLSVQLGWAQQPKQLQQRQIERKPAVRKALVADIRTATPLMAKARTAGDTRAVVGPSDVIEVTGRLTRAARSVALTLDAAQLKDMLAQGGVQNVSPAGEYVRFGPRQLSVDGKGWMMLQAPLWIDPLMIQFDGTLDENQWLNITSGPKIWLVEGGTFVLDYLFDIPAADPGKAYRCDVMKNDDVLQQINFTEDTPGPQHLLVVFQQAQSDSPDVGPLIGLRIHNAGPEAHPDWIRWSLYQVVVTKL